MVRIERNLEMRGEHQAFLGHLLDLLRRETFQSDGLKCEDSHALFLRELRVQQSLQLKVSYWSQINLYV